MISDMIFVITRFEKQAEKVQNEYACLVGWCSVVFWKRPFHHTTMYFFVSLFYLEPMCNSLFSA